MLGRLSSTIERLFAWPRPVVVALNGHAIAGGCVIAATADYRVMTSFERARIGVRELMVGVPFPTAALEVMRYRVPNHLEELVLTGRLMDPAAARDLNLVEELAAPEVVLDRACEVAAQLASIPATTYAMTKAHLRLPALERIERLTPELDEQVLGQWSRPETLAGIRSFLEATVGKK
jgi:enoyl-CoA hydratase